MGQFRHYRNSNCRVCGSSDLELYLDLGAQPPSNAFIDTSEIPEEESFPLAVHVCRNCFSSQLLDVVHGEDVFKDYHYLSSSSRALREHFQGMVDTLLERHKPEQSAVIVDVGANDGITLDRYPKGQFNLIGVEPSSAGNYAKEKGHTILSTFFGPETGKQIRSEYGEVSLATATNVCAHMDNIQDFMMGFSEMLSPSGVAVFECSYLPDMFEGIYFDTIYHEHLCYHSLTPLVKLFSQTGLRALHAERVAFGASGPAVRVTVGKADGEGRSTASIDNLLAEEDAWGIKDIATYHRFADQVRNVITELRDEVTKERDAGRRMGAFTAPAKGNTLLNSTKLTSAELEAVAENNELKCGTVTPGSHIPVISDAEFLERNFDSALLLSWNYADFFVENAQFVKNGGRFLVPLPKPVFRP